MERELNSTATRAEIQRLRQAGESLRSLARAYAVSHETIRQLLQREV